MEPSAPAVLLVALLGTASAISFYGDSVSFMPVKKNKDGTFRVSFSHRQNGRSSCSDEQSLNCESGVCTTFDQSRVLQTDQNAKGDSTWCQTEGFTTATVSTNEKYFNLSGSGCCWAPNVGGRTNWTTHAELDLGTRSDSHTLNVCPVTTTVSSLRVPQNCFSVIRLLAHDPDSDDVKCTLSAGASLPSNFSLDVAECMLTSAGEVGVGVHIFELMLEDFPTQNITVTYDNGMSVFHEASDMNSPPLCKVKLQFLVEILPPIPQCEMGHVQPMFLSGTPSHGDVLHATVGQPFNLRAQAQAHHSSIMDFQVSGPQNMSKVFISGEHGTADLTVTWTPQKQDLYGSIPFCFTAETPETQSEMRCVVVLVTQASILQGKAIVECSPNKMMVTLDKASMPGIDDKFLKLNDPSCSLTANDTHIMGSMSFSTCGTKLEDIGDFIAFTNEINSFELPNEIITRRKTVKIGFSCQFPKTISVSNYYNLHKSDYIFTESSFGSFVYTFDIFKDANFTDRVEASAYPVEVKLLETVYMGIQAQSELPNVKLFVESCKATPDDNPENTRSYDLIKDGCMKDETLKIHPTNDTVFNFEIQAFKFTGIDDQVYITCSVIMCESGSPFSRCAEGCLPTPTRRRRRRGTSKETDSHTISQGPLQFVGPSAPHDNSVLQRSDKLEPVSPPPVPENTMSRNSEGQWGGQILGSHISTIVFASAFIVSLLLMIVALVYIRRMRNQEDRKALIVSVYEN
ncbi:hypothetical protein JOB18_005707 [Solea senegalensis]|uniref:ZP domain-containing protein n=1 Tax=Solea senegalensis TaxID=28829 RepID=A0AAV6Q3Q8_SOLSE|nr:uncharacterized protein LOC122772549 [Solea senegalensis]KAG7481807.1 hypothetical protein JOB18_005707 [Solea senegalensis]